MTWFAIYEAYGTRPFEWGTNLDRQKANTKDEEAELGLLNEGMRYRDLETGTFLTRDPIRYADGPNMYCYVHCNPITSFDPLGLNSIESHAQEVKNAMTERDSWQAKIEENDKKWDKLFDKYNAEGVGEAEKERIWTSIEHNEAMWSYYSGKLEEAKLTYSAAVESYKNHLEEEDFGYYSEIAVENGMVVERTPVIQQGYFTSDRPSMSEEEHKMRSQRALLYDGTTLLGSSLSAYDDFGYSMSQGNAISYFSVPAAAAVGPSIISGLRTCGQAGLLYYMQNPQQVNDVGLSVVGGLTDGLPYSPPSTPEGAFIQNSIFLYQQLKEE